MCYSALYSVGNSKIAGKLSIKGAKEKKGCCGRFSNIMTCSNNCLLMSGPILLTGMTASSNLPLLNSVAGIQQYFLV